MATYTGTPSTATAGGTITAANWNADVRDVVNALAGAWNAYTPTLAQGAATNVAKTVTYAKYIRVGKLIIARIQVAPTAGSAAAGSAITLSLPVTAATSGIYVGSGMYNRGGTYYGGMVYLNATGTLAISHVNATDGGLVGVSPNMAITSGDTFGVEIMYEAA